MSRSPSVKDVLIVGCGAVGSIYAYILKRSGLARVTVVARSNYVVVLENGIDIESKKYGNTTAWRPDRLVKSVKEAADTQYSYVVVTTKAIPEIINTPTIVDALLSSPYTDQFTQPTYVLFQNGLGLERDLYGRIKSLGQGEPKIISSIVWIGINLIGQNRVEHNHFDKVTVGIYRHGDHLTTSNSEEESETLRGFGDILEAGGTNVTVVPEIQRYRFAKTFWNIIFSSFTTLTNSPVMAIFRPPPPPPATPGNADEGQVPPYAPYVAPITERLVREETHPVLKSILEEMVAVGRAMGWPDEEGGLPSSLVSETIEWTTSVNSSPEAKHTPSMLVDYRNASPIEVEPIFGEVVRMARERNVPIPRIETLYALLVVIQNQILGGFKKPLTY